MQEKTFPKDRFDKEAMGNRLQNVRKRLDLTQSEMAHRLDVKQSYYNRVEHGRFEVGASFIYTMYIELFPYFRWILTGQTDKDVENMYASEPQEVYVSELHRENVELSQMLAIYKEHRDDYKQRLEEVEKKLREALGIVS